MWSRMHVSDESNDFINKYSCLTFTDFIEALARMCDMKQVPTNEELEKAEFETRIEW